MLYLIGGAARAGKTRLALRLFQAERVPYFCVDYFVSALQMGIQEAGIQGEMPTQEKARRLWPRMEGMLINIVEVEPAYTVEGDSLLPGGAAGLAERYPNQVRTCFLGYTDITPERKLAEIRQHAGGLNDWIQDHTDAYILDLCVEMIEFSRYVAEECRRYGLAYFDVSQDFQAVLEGAYGYLVNSPTPALPRMPATPDIQGGKKA